MQRLKLCYLFFISTLKINVPLSIVFSFTVAKGDWDTFLLFFPSFLGGIGIVSTFLYKELFEKDAYYYYRNAGLSKIHLILFVCAIYWIIIAIIKLCLIPLL